MAALVVALNPCIDAEWRVADVVWEEKNSILSERRWAGGKGINVARWLRFLTRAQTGAFRRQNKLNLAEPPRLLLPLGGQSGAELARYLRLEQLKVQSIRLRDPTRVNVIVTTAAVRQLRFNPLGPTLSRREWNLVRDHVRRRLSNADYLILSGSVPRGVPVTAYATLVRLARAAGIRTLLDCDGPAFIAAIKARPFLVKPNVHELSQWRGKLLRSESALVQAATDLSHATQGWVLVSRGPAGAVLIHQKQGTKIFAQPAPIRPVNTIGAGDALWGVAVGTAAAKCRPGELPRRSLIEKMLQQVASKAPTGRRKEALISCLTSQRPHSGPPRISRGHRSLG